MKEPLWRGSCNSVKLAKFEKLEQSLNGLEQSLKALMEEVRLRRPNNTVIPDRAGPSRSEDATNYIYSHLPYQSWWPPPNYHLQQYGNGFYTPESHVFPSAIMNHAMNREVKSDHVSDDYVNYGFSSEGLSADMFGGGYNSAGLLGTKWVHTGVHNGGLNSGIDFGSVTAGVYGGGYSSTKFVGGGSYVSFSPLLNHNINTPFASNSHPINQNNPSDNCDLNKSQLAAYPHCYVPGINFGMDKGMQEFSYLSQEQASSTYSHSNMRSNENQFTQWGEYYTLGASTGNYQPPDFAPTPISDFANRDANMGVGALPNVVCNGVASNSLVHESTTRCDLNSDSNVYHVPPFTKPMSDLQLLRSKASTAGRSVANDFKSFQPGVIIESACSQSIAWIPLTDISSKILYAEIEESTVLRSHKTSSGGDLHSIEPEMVITADVAIDEDVSNAIDSASTKKEVENSLVNLPLFPSLGTGEHLDNEENGVQHVLTHEVGADSVFEDSNSDEVNKCGEESLVAESAEIPYFGLMKERKHPYTPLKPCPLGSNVSSNFNSHIYSIDCVDLYSCIGAKVIGNENSEAVGGIETIQKNDTHWPAQCHVICKDLATPWQKSEEFPTQTCLIRELPFLEQHSEDIKNSSRLNVHENVDSKDLIAIGSTVCGGLHGINQGHELLKYFSTFDDMVNDSKVEAQVSCYKYSNGHLKEYRGLYSIRHGTIDNSSVALSIEGEVSDHAWLGFTGRIFAETKRDISQFPWKPPWCLTKNWLLVQKTYADSSGLIPITKFSMFLEYKDYKPELPDKTMELATRNYKATISFQTSTEKWNKRILHWYDLIVCWLGASVGYIFFRVKFKLGTKFSTQVTSSREAITRITLNFGAALSNSDSNSDFGMDHSKYYFDRPMKFLITTPDGSYIRNLRTKLAIASKFCSHLNQSSGLHFKNTECNSSVPEHLTSCFGLPLPFKELRSHSLGVTKTKCHKISFYLQVDSVTPSARASNTVFIEGYYKYGIFLHYLGLTSTHQPCIMSFVDVKSLVQVSTTSLSLEIMLMQELLHFDGTEAIVVLTSNLSYVKKFDQLNIEASMFAEGWKYNNDIKTQLPKPLATKSCGLFDEAQLCTTGCRVSTFNMGLKNVQVMCINVPQGSKVAAVHGC